MDDAAVGYMHFETNRIDHLYDTNQNQHDVFERCHDFGVGPYVKQKHVYVYVYIIFQQHVVP